MVVEQRVQLAESLRQQRELVENVVHDVATPLSVLQGQLSALSQTSNDDLLRRAMNETQYVTGLLEELAVLARVREPTLELTRVEFRDLVERVAERHTGLAQRLGITFERAVPGIPVYVECDPTLAERALTNLVTNALRYGHEGGHVALLLDVQQSSFTVSVLDDGAGLADDELARVLIRGERASNTASGSGLGLAIVQDVAERLGWRFTLVPGESTGLVACLSGPRSGV
jgi:signal transduction histidine kinase